MSLPMIAEVEVNWPPVTCMPSPESPAKRMVTASSSSIGSFVLVIGSSSVVADITNSILLFFGCEHHSLQGCVSRASWDGPDCRIHSISTSDQYSPSRPDCSSGKLRWGALWTGERETLGPQLVEQISKWKYNTSPANRVTAARLFGLVWFFSELSR